MLKFAWPLAMTLFLSAASIAQGIPPATQIVTVTDPQLGMVAMRMSIPAGWRFAGTVVRQQGCHANGPSLKFTAQNPDGSMGFAQMPGVQWSTSRVGLKQGCSPVNLQSASEFLVNIAAPNLRPGSVITAILPPTPERAAQLAQMTQQRNAILSRMAAQYGQRNTSSFRAEGARVRVNYDHNGRAMEAQINAAVNCTDGINPMSERTRACTVDAISMAYAPAGRLDTLLQSAFYTNIPHEAQVNPQWDQRLANDSSSKFNTMMAGNAANQSAVMAAGAAAGQARQISAAAYQEQAQIKNQTRQHEHDAQMAGYAQHNNLEASRSNAVHSSAQQTVLFAGNQAQFVDPGNGRQIVTNNDYNHQWLSGDGQTVLQANDHTFDPNGVVGSQAWTELVPR